MTTYDQPGHDWTVVLRRRPARIIEGLPEGGYTDVFEVICCYCGDHPYLDYRTVSQHLRLIRGPYTIAAGIAALEEHLRLHQPPWLDLRDQPPIVLAPSAAAGWAG